MKRLIRIFLLKTGFLLLLLPGTRAQQVQEGFDIRTLQHIAHTRTEGQTRIFRFISDANNYVNLGVPAGLLMAGVIDNNKAMRQNALYVASSTLSTALLNFGLKQLFKRKRPFKGHVNFVAVYEPSGYSFPSGHTSSSVSTVTALSRAYPKWYVIAPSVLWAGSVGYSRMYLGVHYPTDVTAGAALGVATAFGMGFIRP